jgi:hypothetical protein
MGGILFGKIEMAGTGPAGGADQLARRKDTDTESKEKNCRMWNV